MRLASDGWTGYNSWPCTICVVSIQSAEGQNGTNGQQEREGSLPVLQVGWQWNTSGSRFCSVAQNRSGLLSDGCYWPSIIVISLAFVLS